MVANIKLLNPDFEYLYFDDQQIKDFIDKQFPEYLSVFEAFRFNIQKIDFFRYLAIYHYGGFYFDLDVLLASNLDGLRSSVCVFPFECIAIGSHLRNTLGVNIQIGNYAFGAAAGHRFLEAVIDNCVRAQRDRDWVKPMMRDAPVFSRSEFYVLNTTGPGLVTRTWAENADLAAQVTVLAPDDVCDPGSWWRFGDYGIHLMSGSWRQERNVLGRKVANFLEYRHRVRMAKKSALLGVT